MRTFRDIEIWEAYGWAEAGFQALHLHSILTPRAPRCFVTAVERGEQICHYFDQHLDRLVKTARRFGVRVICVEREGTFRQHIDLCGAPLRKLLHVATPFFDLSGNPRSTLENPSMKATTGWTDFDRNVTGSLSVAVGLAHHQQKPTCLIARGDIVQNIAPGTETVPGWEEIGTVQPENTHEEIMGLMKRLYAMRAGGRPIPRHVLEWWAGPPRSNPVAGELLLALEADPPQTASGHPVNQGQDQQGHYRAGTLRKLIQEGRVGAPLPEPVQDVLPTVQTIEGPITDVQWGPGVAEIVEPRPTPPWQDTPPSSAGAEIIGALTEYRDDLRASNERTRAVREELAVAEPAEPPKPQPAWPDVPEFRRVVFMVLDHAARTFGATFHDPLTGADVDTEPLPFDADDKRIIDALLLAMNVDRAAQRALYGRLPEDPRGVETDDAIDRALLDIRERLAALAMPQASPKPRKAGKAKASAGQRSLFD